MACSRPRPNAPFAICQIWLVALLASQPLLVQASSSAAEHSGMPDGRALVQTAQQYLGIPYVWGGQGRDGFDCSGLMAAVYLRHGYQLPRVSRQQALVGLSVQGAYAPGDLLFFSEKPGATRITHVAMSMGGRRFIHAALGKGQVTYDSLDERYYQQRLVGARRLLALPPGAYATAQGLAIAGAAIDSLAQRDGILAMGVRTDKAASGPKAAADPNADMLVEHAGALPQQLHREEARAVAWQGVDDPFGADPLLPVETGMGMRFGLMREPRATAAFGALDFRYLGHGNGVQADLAIPYAIRFSHAPGESESEAGSWGSFRQVGRIVRRLRLGQEDAKLFVGLGRTEAITLGEGQVVRHYFPNVNSASLNDALLLANALSLQASYASDTLAVRGAIDDIFAPQVVGAMARVQLPDPRLTLQASYASDVRAPWREPRVTQQPLRPRSVHAFAVGPSMLLHHNELWALRGYADFAGLIANTRPSQPGFGADIGLLATIGHRGVNAMHATLRLEGRLGSARWHPNYFGFGYAQTRARMTAATATANALPQLSVLLAQRTQPPQASGLIEFTLAAGGWLSLGVAYEDGGYLRQTQAGPLFVARSITTFVQLLNIPLGSTRLLRGRMLWHSSNHKRVGLASRLPDTYGQTTIRADIFEWLDVGVEAVKPMGLLPPHTRGLSVLVDVSAHVAF